MKWFHRLTAKVYGWTVWLFEPYRHLKATHSLAKVLQPRLSVMFWLAVPSSPRPSPLLNGFTFQFILFYSQLHHLYFSLISSSAPQPNAVQICGHSSKQSLLKYVEIYVNCPCWLCIAFLYSFALSSKLVLTQPKSASNVLTLTCFFMVVCII